MYQLCESNCGYTVYFKVYTGKEGEHADINHTKTIVMELMQSLLGQGYMLWTDNYYTGVYHLIYIYIIHISCWIHWIVVGHWPADIF